MPSADKDQYALEELCTSVSALLNDINQILLRAALKGETISPEQVRHLLDKLEWARTQVKIYNTRVYR